MENYKSATDAQYKAKVDKQIQAELAEGYYQIVNSKPCMVSALGAIPKSNGGIRLIHDCSRPAGAAVNDMAKHEEFSMQSVDNAVSMIDKNWYMGKVDLKNAYRSIPISKNSQRVTGLSWVVDGKKVYMVDTRLPFGARASPYIFNKVTQSVRYMMEKRGFHNIVVYLDDFWVCANSYHECSVAMDTLLKLLRSLGFHINWSKVEGPSKCMTFLGIEINSEEMTLAIPKDKLEDTIGLVHTFLARRRSSKKQLQSLVGRLSWLARVVSPGRIFLRALIEAMSKAKAAAHKVIHTSAMREDLLWWAEVAPLINGTMAIKGKIPISSVITDACPIGGAGVFNNDWFYVNWAADSPLLANLHINYKELLCTVLAARRWAALWKDRVVIFYTDSMVTKGMLQKGKCRDPVVRSLLKELYMQAVVYNFHIESVHVPGVDNVLADSISRLHIPNKSQEVLALFPQLLGIPFQMGFHNLEKHMSLASVLFLFLQRCPLVFGRIGSKEEFPFCNRKCTLSQQRQLIGVT